jgi:cold shock CspA family protein
MTMGRVALFDKVGGYGFIATTDGAPRIYVDGVDLIRSGFVSLAIGEEHSSSRSTKAWTAACVP